MSRKIILGDLRPGETPDLAADSPRTPRARMRPILGAQGLVDPVSTSPVGAIGRSLDSVAQRAQHAEAIEKQLAQGLAVVELDPNTVEPSFLSDRMPASADAQDSLVESIRENGQQVPILVRPHPDHAQRYQVAFGHRRLRAALTLQRPVRAVVRSLSDEELVVAQGQENNERRDLSYIEKARFAHTLERRFGRQTVLAALSLYKSDCSNMISVVARIPAAVIEAIGPAPGTGRRGWIALAEAVAKKGAAANVERAVAEPGFGDLPSDERFKRALAATVAKSAPAKAAILRDGKKNEIGRLAIGKERVVLAIDRRKAPAFADFVVERLNDLYRDFEAGRDRS